LPIICGGSGMYIKALQYGLDDLPGDRELRKQLDAQYDNPASLPDLLERTRREDPAAYEKYSTNQRKMIRALEVRLLTGQSIITLQQNKMLHPAYNALTLALTPDREYLRRRIAARAGKMLKSGWLEEAEALLKLKLLETPTARQAIGYGLIGEYLAGELDFEQLNERIVTATWQFARRQLTWFRHQHPEATQLEYQDNLSWDGAVEQLCRQSNRKLHNND
ncbi:MAG: tRNA dimethylallyltransferase, partial [Victivallaceae bacterium]